MSREEQTALLSGPDFQRFKVATAIEDLFDAMKTDVSLDPQSPRVHTKLTGKDKKIYVASGIAAMLSALMFWSSSDKAGRRDGMGDWRYLSDVGGAGTNGVFNWESYLAILALFSQQRLSGEANLISVKGELAEWVGSAVISFFVVLGMWAVSLTGDPVEGILATVSAVLNLPVNAFGAIVFIAWFKKFDFEARSIDWLGAHLWRAETKRQENLALRQARDLIAGQLRDQVSAFENLLTAKRSSVLEDLMQGSCFDIFKKLLDKNIADENHLSIERSGCFKLNIRLSYAVLAFTGIASNFGFAVASYEGGRKLVDTAGFGWICALMNIIPSLGFSIKGLLSLWGWLGSIERGERSMGRVEMPATYLTACVLSIIFASFSGFSGDEAGYESWQKYCSALGGEVGAVISGIVHNIGSAFAFNLPFCIYFVQRVVGIYLMKRNTENDVDKNVKQHLVFVESLKTIADIFEKMPMEVCKYFFQCNKMQEAFFNFLYPKMGNDGGDVKLLGDYYTKQVEKQNHGNTSVPLTGVVIDGGLPARTGYQRLS